MRPRELPYPGNPDYGSGLCRRLIRVTGMPGVVEAHLADNFHEMRCRILHDGSVVTAIYGTAIRVPTSACPAATAVLQELEGIAINVPAADLYSGGQAQKHCTHLYDLAVLAIRHASLGLHDTHYEAIVPDEGDQPVTLTISRNGAICHSWNVQNGSIQLPASLRGKTLDKGFAAWATRSFTDAEIFEAASILARTWLISIGRRYRMEMAAGEPIAGNSEMLGRCFAYDATRAELARYSLGNSRSSSEIKV